MTKIDKILYTIAKIYRTKNAPVHLSMMVKQSFGIERVRIFEVLFSSKRYVVQNKNSKNKETFFVVFVQNRLVRTVTTFKSLALATYPAHAMMLGFKATFW